MPKIKIRINPILGEAEDSIVIDLPLTKARYAELKEGINTQNTAWQEVQKAVENIAEIKGFNKFTYSVKLRV